MTNHQWKPGDRARWPPAGVYRKYPFDPLTRTGGDGYDAFTPLWASRFKPVIRVKAPSRIVEDRG